MKAYQSIQIVLFNQTQFDHNTPSNNVMYEQFILSLFMLFISCLKIKANLFHL